MSKQSAKMTYRLSDGTETTYHVELQPESDYSIMDKGFYLAGIRAENERITARLNREREKHVPWCGQSQPCPECYQTIGLETAIALVEGENNE